MAKSCEQDELFFIRAANILRQIILRELIPGSEDAQVSEAIQLLSGISGDAFHPDLISGLKLQMKISVDLELNALEQRQYLLCILSAMAANEVGGRDTIVNYMREC